FERLEHSVRIGCLFRDDLEHVPVLDDLSIAFQSEDVDARPSVITGPILPTMKNDVVSLGYDSFELDMFAGVIARHALEVVYERLLSVANSGVVLDVRGASVARDRFAWLALIEC